MLKTPSVVVNEGRSRPELLEAIDLVTREKGLSVADVFDAMEKAIKKVATSKYGNLYNIRATINKHTGEINIFRVFTVVDDVENFYHQITLEDAQKQNPDYILGDEILEALPDVDFTRGYVQSFRQIVTMRVKEAEKAIEYEANKDKIGEIVSGVVKRVEFGNVFVELSNKFEAFLHRNQTIPRENLEVGMRIRVLIQDVQRDMKAAQIRVTRYSKEFIKKLFMQEIQEIYDGTVEIKSIARDAGSRSKVALYSSEPSIDPISMVLGFKGSKIQGILSELKGEKIDLLHYSENVVTFVTQAFYPTEVLKVVIDEDSHSLEVVVRDEDLSLAIGRRGQNINLIASLVGWTIDLIGETAEKEKSQNDLASNISYFKSTIDVDETISQLLILEGYSSVEEIIEDQEGLATIPAFDANIIAELVKRSEEYLEKEKQLFLEKILALGANKNLLDCGLLTKEEILILLENDVKSLEDLADLSMFELVDILPKNTISEEEASEIITEARQAI